MLSPPLIQKALKHRNYNGRDSFFFQTNTENTGITMEKTLFFFQTTTENTGITMEKTVFFFQTKTETQEITIVLPM